MIHLLNQFYNKGNEPRRVFQDRNTWPRSHPFWRGTFFTLQRLRVMAKVVARGTRRNLTLNLFNLPISGLSALQPNPEVRGRDLNELPGPDSGAGGKDSAGLRGKARGGGEGCRRGERGRRSWRARGREARCSWFFGGKGQSSVPPASHVRLQSGLNQPGIYASCRMPLQYLTMLIRHNTGYTALAFCRFRF